MYLKVKTGSDTPPDVASIIYTKACLMIRK